MKIYLAGNTAIKERERERFIFQLRANRLFSYFHHATDKEFFNEFKLLLKWVINENLFSR
jgi:hypothetical protein